MDFLNRLKNKPDPLDVPPLPALVSEVIDDAELGVKYRVALMMQSITQHVIREYEADLVSLPDSEDIDDYYVLSLRLGQYAANLLDSRQDPEYQFKPVPHLMLPVTELTERS